MGKVTTALKNTWVEVGSNVIVRHKTGSGQIAYSSSELNPGSYDSTTPLLGTTTLGEVIDFSGVGTVWAYALSSNCSMSVSDLDSVDSAVESYDNISGNRIRTSSLGIQELFTAEGSRFNHEFDFVFAGSETKYFLYEMPIAGSTISTVALQKRRFKSRDGAAELEVLWDSTGYTAGTPEKIYNENRASSIVSQMTISEISAPTTEGEVRESDFLVSEGSGNNTSGDLTEASGFRTYPSGSFFIAKVTNLESSSNRIIVAYNWFELTDYMIVVN